MKTAILFILMMLVLIAPHEFGHFIVAKLCHVQVNEFSVGMGPLLWKRRKGETQYSLRAIPIGGYCAMEGEDDSSDNPRAFNNKPAIQRIAILIAGVTMNVVIAVLVCSLAYQISGIPINTLDEVVKNTPAYEAGIEAGDKIVEIDGTKTDSWESVITEIGSYNGQGDISVVVDRNGDEIKMSLTPVYNKERDTYTIGIVAAVSKNPLRCIAAGTELTKELGKKMFEAFGMLFSGKLHKDDVSGPVGLVKVVNQTASAGITPYLILLALVSLNLALINLLPIPGLDGGKLLFVLLKVVTGGRINDESEYKASLIGMVLLLSLMIFITINDISNLF